MPTYLEVQNLCKSFGSFRALDDVSFSIPRGEFVCFLGPSGCGKTTLLRCIAGLEIQSSGTIRQDGHDISRLPPSRRDFGIVFQSYALFPNLNVADNIAFGLVSQRRPRAEIKARVAELVELIGLVGEIHKYPTQLSGGQQQRVALARSLAPSPGLLLLDEPLSALDAKVRVRLRREIREVQKRLGVTTIMVTHDQEEALSMADRILVMNGGKVVQIGGPDDIYDRPATAFVADFIGQMNFLEGTVCADGAIACQGVSLAAGPHGLPVGSAVAAAFRPEDVVCDAEAGRNVFEVGVAAREDLGPVVRLHLRAVGSGLELRADLPKRAAGRLPADWQQALTVHIPADRIHVFGRAP